MITTWPFGHLTPMKYGAILCDNPWRYEMYSDKGYEKSPEAHYQTMSDAELRELPVSELAGPSCLLFMWSTWPHLQQAVDLMKFWGFEYRTGGAWIKRTPSGKLTFGTGYVQRSACEPYLIGRIGRPETASKSDRNVIAAPELIPDMMNAVRREHSRKPPEMRAMIDRLLPRAYKCELFAREAWADNDVWGNQIDKFGGQD